MLPKVLDLIDGSMDQISALGETKDMVLLDKYSLDLDSTDKNQGGRKAYVVFDGVRCTDETFVIDIFLKAKSRAPLNKTELQSELANPYFVGTSTRIGMGDAATTDSKGQRCIRQGVERFIPLSLIPAEIENLGTEEIEVVLKVTNLTQNTEVEKETYEKMSGFTGRFYWDEPIKVLAQASTETGITGTLEGEPTKQCCT
ncbi:hypothetical protein AA313_de0200815 [Arthrobotrys entomopaga]|nr:hypothetical protein AA313_de0200815 [Arthrobotrys entomopaga]